MGMNYYLHDSPTCEHCGRDSERIHIGKSSWGWMFSLHVMPEEGINTLDDWRERWSRPGAMIKNEEGEVVSIAEMESTITERKAIGEYELKRHDFHNTVGYGEGTWDYVGGEFS